MTELVLDKPRPDITDFTRPFWDAARDNTLLIQQCACCANTEFLPRPWCSECGSRDLQWRPSTGLGSVYAFSIANVVMMNRPGWTPDLPVVLTLVDLDDGPRMYARIVGPNRVKTHINMRVEVTFESVGGGVAIPVFRQIER